MGTSSNSVGLYPVSLRSVNLCWASLILAFLQHDDDPSGSDRLEIPTFTSVFRTAPFAPEPLPLPVALIPEEELGWDRRGLPRGVRSLVSDVP